MLDFCPGGNALRRPLRALQGAARKLPGTGWGVACRLGFMCTLVSQPWKLVAATLGQVVGNGLAAACAEAGARLLC